MKPVYFDLSVKDISAARGFLEQAFGWKFEHFPMPFEYYRITAGPPDEPGIDGGIGRSAEAGESSSSQLVSLTLPVMDLKKMIAKIEACGGAIMGPILPIPGVGQHVTCSGPGGLMFGLLQAEG
jgi:predicted enzyme related to lactoylglutathione lyase